MLTIEKTVLPSPEQWGIIIEGMRNPMNSWERSDSAYTDEFVMGSADLRLMEKLAKGGPVHAKYRRMIPVMLTVTAPTFWWIEFDTYKIGTVRNSCSKMHKIHAEPFALDNFSLEGVKEVGGGAMEYMVSQIHILEWLRQKFSDTGEKRYWRAMIEMLPHGYMMKSTMSLNYEVLANIYHSRKNHKLGEWHTFCEWIEGLPFSEIITGREKENG